MNEKNKCSNRRNKELLQYNQFISNMKSSYLKQCLSKISTKKNFNRKNVSLDKK